MDVLTARLPARHGFFTRNGGYSTGVFASLNCSLSGADAVPVVLRNRALVAAAMGVEPGQLVGLKQVHGTGVVRVDVAWAIGAGPAGDAMVTSVPGIALGIVTADCAPVLFSDATGGVVGAAHAGWRGAVAGVLEATVAALLALGGEGITAAIGPCIHQASYEVGGELRDAVLAEAAADAACFSPGRGDRWQFDLPGYCAARLARVGVAAAIVPHDTCAEEAMFFSHRRRVLRGEPAIGHQMSVIVA
jgi:YfiH family protein